MLKLIKLELRRNNLKPYIITSICIFIFTVGFCFLITIATKVMPEDLDMLEMTSSFNSLIPMFTTMSLAFFAILSAVMHAKFSVEEYTGKKSILLFSYPQKRSQILRAKCTFIFLFISIIMIISNVTAISLFGLASNSFGIIPDTFHMGTFIELLKYTAITSLVASVIGLISLRIGFARKSIIATIITGVLLVSPFGNVASFFSESMLSILIISGLVLIIISVLLFLNLLSKVNKMESM